jgi:hypothetical protein
LAANCSTRSTSVVPRSTACRANSISRRLQQQGCSSRGGAGRRWVRGERGQERWCTTAMQRWLPNQAPAMHHQQSTALQSSPSYSPGNWTSQLPPEQACIDALLPPHVDPICHPQSRDAIAAAAGGQPGSRARWLIGSTARSNAAGGSRCAQQAAHWLIEAVGQLHT